MRSSAFFSACLVVALALATGGLAFVAGKSAADPAGAYDRGVAAGERLGREQARDDLRPGDEQYEAILARGHAGGLQAGRRTGRLLGVRSGRARGRDDAFGSFPGGWQVGRWYAVSITSGDDGARYGIGSRAALDEGSWYGVCRDARQLCHRRAADPGDAAGGRRKRSERTASP